MSDRTEAPWKIINVQFGRPGDKTYRRLKQMPTGLTCNATPNEIAMFDYVEFLERCNAAMMQVGDKVEELRAEIGRLKSAAAKKGIKKHEQQQQPA